MKMTKAKFLKLLPVIRLRAKELGYAIGLHGTLNRDYDIIAIPWTEEAVSQNEIAEAIFEVTKAIRWRIYEEDKPIARRKPHGRLCYAFDWDKKNNENKNYCDLSVMPRI